MPTTQTAMAREERGFIYNGTAALHLTEGPIDVEALLQSVGTEGRGRLIGPGPLNQYPPAGTRTILTLVNGTNVTIVCSNPVRYRPPGFNTKYTGEAEVAFTFELADIHD